MDCTEQWMTSKNRLHERIVCPFVPSIIISYVKKDSKIVYSSNNRHEFRYDKCLENILERHVNFIIQNMMQIISVL